MKIFPSLKKFVVYSLVLLVSVCSLLFTAPTAIAAVDSANTQYIAFDTTSLTAEGIDEIIAYYRAEKQAVSKSEILTTETIKEILKEINSEINALIKQKKALSVTN
jgi:hypothetical protein